MTTTYSESAPRKRSAPSQHKAVIYFLDGVTGRFKSNDKFTTTGKINPMRGLNGLRKLIKKHAGKFETALIYNIASDTMVEKYDGNANFLPLNTTNENVGQN